MKKLSTNIINENGETKKIIVFVEDETAAALAHCDEESRHLYKQTIITEISSHEYHH